MRVETRPARDVVSAESYNYAVFPSDDDVEYFARFADRLKVGEEAPDPPLTDLDSGEEIRLSAFSRRGLTVVELGSLT